MALPHCKQRLKEYNHDILIPINARRTLLRSEVVSWARLMSTQLEIMDRCQHGWSAKRPQPGQIGSKPHIPVDLSTVGLGVTLGARPTANKILTALDLSIVISQD